MPSREQLAQLLAGETKPPTPPIDATERKRVVRLHRNLHAGIPEEPSDPQVILSQQTQNIMNTIRATHQYPDHDLEPPSQPIQTAAKKPKPGEVVKSPFGR